MTPEKRKRRRNPFRRWFRLFIFLLILMTVGVSAGVSGLLVYIGTLPPIEQLERYAPPQVTRVVDRTGRHEIATYKREYRVLAEINEVPDLLIKAFLASEDQNFYRHFGIDFKAVVRAIWINFQRGRMSQGFSTITLQLPRNIGETGRERALKRKLRDIVLALQIEKRYSKDQILMFYLNQVYLGNSAYGVKAAAKAYFNKEDLRDLTLSECAFLAGLPQKPHIYGNRNRPEGRDRRDMILRRMKELGFIDPEVCDRTLREPLLFRSPESTERYAAPYFVSYLEKWLSDEAQITSEALRSKGYAIRSTMDVRMQRIVEEELTTGLIEVERKWHARKNMRLADAPELGAVPAAGEQRLAEIVAVTSPTAATSGSIEARVAGSAATVALPNPLPYYEPDRILSRGELVDVLVTDVDATRRRFQAVLFDTKPIQGAAIVMDARNGEILAMSGGTDFYNPSYGWLNRAFQSQRQVGSCFKPLVFALGLDAGLSPSSRFDDRPIPFANGYIPRNYENRYFGPTTLLTALEHSRNVVTIQLYVYLLNRLGPSTVRARLRNFDMVGGRSWDFRATDVSTALGSLVMAPLELASAYTAFVNHGVAKEPIVATRITDLNYLPIRDFRADERVVIGEKAAYQMVYLMRSVIANGTGRPIAQYFANVRAKNRARRLPQMAGKTGTTDDCSDAWFAGYTPELVVVVFVGFETPRTLGPQMTGSYVAAPIWWKILDRILETNATWQMAFEPPAGMGPLDIYSEYERAVAEETAGGEETIAAPAAGEGAATAPGAASASPSRTSPIDPWKGFKEGH